MDQHHLIPKLDGYQAYIMIDGYTIDGYTSSGDITSEPIPLMRWRSYSCSITCPADGTPSGTVKLQLCNDMERDDGKADSTLTNWLDIDGASSALSGASVITIDDPNCTYRWMRVVYTRSSGDITLTVQVQLKGLRS